MDMDIDINHNEIYELESNYIKSETLNVIKILQPYINKNKLQLSQSIFELQKYRDNKTAAIAHKKLLNYNKNFINLKELKEKVIIKFNENIPKFYNIKDDCNLNITIKNVKKIILKIFKINTFPYFIKHQKEVSSDLNLEGLTPSIDKEIEIKNFSSSFKIQQIPLNLSYIKNKRGLFFIDIVGNGQHSRAIIRKGDLKYIERLGPAGHVFRLIDENYNKINNNKCKIWCDGQLYNSNEKGDIFIPFCKIGHEGRKTIILIDDNHNGFNILSEFNHKAELYRLFTLFYIERESILDKHETNVIIKNNLYINECQISLNLLKNIIIKLTITDINGTTTTKNFTNISIK